MTLKFACLRVRHLVRSVNVTACRVHYGGQTVPWKMKPGGSRELDAPYDTASESIALSLHHD
jgi:hypothetical protein